MAVVRIRINGREYDLACDDGQEEHLRHLAEEVDGRVRALGMGTLNNPGEVMCLLLASLTMADELLETRGRTAAPQDHAAEQARIAAQQERERAAHERQLAEMEMAMAATLDDIAVRIEKIAEQIEIR